MKTKFLIPVVSALAMMTFNLAHASGADDALARCRAGADDRYDTCNRMTNDAGQTNNCDAKLDRAYDNCQTAYNSRVDMENRGARYDSNGRFTPTPIPQRPVYTLPGSR